MATSQKLHLTTPVWSHFGRVMEWNPEGQKKGKAKVEYILPRIRRYGREPV